MSIAKSVADKAMLAHLRVGVWKASAYDPRATQKVDEEFGVSGAGNFTKRLINQGSMKKLKNIVSEARAYHYEHTLPWIDEGPRILPAARLFEYNRVMSAHEANFRQAVSDFASDYPNLKSFAQADLGPLFSPTDYPDDTAIADRFKFSVTITPFPTTDDFRVTLGEEAMASLKSELESKIKDNIGESSKELTRRLVDRLGHFAERMKAYKVDENGKIEAPFKKATLDNLAETLSIAADLNVAGDATISEAISEAKAKLAELKPDDLRKSEAARVSAAGKADEIMAKLQGYGESK